MCVCVCICVCVCVCVCVSVCVCVCVCVCECVCACFMHIWETIEHLNVFHFLQSALSSSRMLDFSYPGAPCSANTPSSCHTQSSRTLSSMRPFKGLASAIDNIYAVVWFEHVLFMYCMYFTFFGKHFRVHQLFSSYQRPRMSGCEG